MTTATAATLQSSLVELIRVTSTVLPADVVRALESSRSGEAAGSNAKYALDVISCNIGLAKDKSQPLCQDTGSVLFYVHCPVGYDQLAFTDATIAAVKEATVKGYLRQNSVDSVSGTNSGDNVGPGAPDFHFHQWRRDYVEVTLMLKGGGCENVGAQYTLPDPRFGGRDLVGVENALLDCVLQAQGQGCGPGILGVCIGGDRASGYAHSKVQLLRTLDDSNGDPVLGALEERIVAKANRSGIGPMGFGGNTTLVGCKIGKLNRVPASFYVTISYMCWAFRRQGVNLSLSGEIGEWRY
ncbi:MAG: fumarate hydratase [Planctomycetes bacterium]|nr:fumarate hydratase [Planctomycetota bacterium]